MSDPHPGRPDVIPSERDPDFECVRIGSQDPSGHAVEPPPGGAEDAGSRLCPEGYVPRRKRRAYRLVGKRIEKDM
jgi:hypothetical protein